MRNSACAHTQVLKCNKSEMPSSEKPAFSQPPFYHFPPNFSIRNYVHEYSLTFFCGLFPSFFPTFFPVRNSHNFTHEVISQHPSHNSHTRSSFWIFTPIFQLDKPAWKKKEALKIKQQPKKEKRMPPTPHTYIRRSFRGGRTIISIPWETHADVREKHILQMEMEVDVGPWMARGRGDGNGRRKILNRTASPPLVRLLAQFECAGAYIIPVDRTILLSAQSQHNSHTRILPAWPEAASVASVASESDSEPGQKPDQSQTKPGGQSSEPRFRSRRKSPPACPPAVLFAVRVLAKCHYQMNF